MKLSTFCFDLKTRWSVKRLPALDSAQTLLFVFASPETADQGDMLAELAKTYPHSTIIGCTTAGEIAGASLQDTSASVAVLKFERSHFKAASCRISGPEDSFAAGKGIADQLPLKDLSTVFVLLDGLIANSSEVLAGLYSALPADITVSGALAGDGDRFRNSRVIHQGEFIPGAVTAVGFYGDFLQITHGSYNGCRKFGPERRVTRSEANILYELDGRPALALYKDYLGKLASGLPATAQALPLSIRQDKQGSSHAVRAMLGFDEASQSIAFNGDIPNGCLAQLMRADGDFLHGTAQSAADALDSMAVAGPMLALTISDIGRRLIFGQRAEEECETMLHALPCDAQQIGFYSYGQIVPHPGKPSAPHNQSILLTIISEA